MQWTVIGHRPQKELIERHLIAGHPAHAYLLTGPAGVGKRRFADDVVIALHARSGDAANPDHLVLAPTADEETGKISDIPIKAVQDLKAWAYQKPLYGSVKTVVIDDADRLGNEAANALLKMLEEPPQYLTFFLVTAQTERLLPTVVSRCQEVSFLPLTADEMREALGGVRLSADDREVLDAVAAGRPGIARRLVGEKRLADVARSVALLERLLKADMVQRLVAAKDIADDGGMAETVSWWLSWVHVQMKMRPALVPVARGLLELSSAVAEPKYNRRLALERFLLDVPA